MTEAARGFTLIEMLVVLAILALVVSLVPPLLASSQGKAELTTAQRQIAAALRDTRGLAIRRDRVESFVLDTGTGGFEGGDGRKQQVPSGIALSLIGAAGPDKDAAAVGRIRFFADGSSTGGAVRLVAAGRQRDVQVDWLSGRVTLVDGDDARR